MFCNKCGAQIADGSMFCNVCGNPVGGNNQQPANNQQNAYNQQQPYNQQPVYIQQYAGCQQPGYNNQYQQTPVKGQKDKLTAGILGIFFGSLGIHKFYLGYSTAGTIMLLITIIGSLLTFGVAGAVMEFIGLIEGIMYLTKSDAEFYNTYELGQKEWF